MNANEMVVDGVVVKRVAFNGVQCFDVSDVVREVCQGATKGSYQEWQAKVKAWCERNGAHHYQADREDFSVYDASIEAQKAGKRRVVMEDMS